MSDNKAFRTSRKLLNLRQGRNDWYSIKNATDTKPAQLMIYDEIGYFGVTASDMIHDLAEIDGGSDIEVHLNSPGGEVFDGLAIYQALKQRSGRVLVVVDALAASIASVIAMAASPGDLHIAKNASLMIHDGFAVSIGNAADMRKMADLLETQSQNIADIYAERTGQSADYWRAQMKDETWFVGQAAVDAGLADQLIDDSRNDPQATWDLSVFSKSAPDASAPEQPAEVTHEDFAGFDPDVIRSAFRRTQA